MSTISAQKQNGAVVLNPAEEKIYDDGAAIKATISKGMDGSVLVSSKVDEPLVQGEVEVGGLLPQVTPDGFTVMVQQVEDVAQAADFVVSQEQVVWEDLKKDFIKIEDDIKKVMDLLIGTIKTDAEKVLTDLVKAAKILEFRFIRPGQSYTMDHAPGRVQAFVDKDGVIKDVKVG